MINNVRGLDTFLCKHKRMSQKYINDDGGLVISGECNLDLSYHGDRLCDIFKLEIIIPKHYPRELPVVKETGEKFEHSPDNHINKADGSMCLGSSLRIQEELSKYGNDFNAFFENFVCPFIWQVSKGKYINGELAHGSQGIFDDYMEIFQVNSPKLVLGALHYLSHKKRYANKYPCVCGCGKRTGKCDQRLKWERTLPRSFYAKEYVALCREQNGK